MDTREKYKFAIIKNIKKFINSDILVCIFNLFKFIFIKRGEKSSSNIEDKLDIFINKVNEKIIKKKENYINKDYSIENFNNIILFVKTQNSIFAGDIIEGILIYVFSFGFHAKQDETFGKHLFSNLYKIRDPKNDDIIGMFETDKFIPNEMHNIKSLLSIDANPEDKIDEYINQKQQNNVLFNLLFQVFFEKYINLKNEKYKKKALYYMNRGFLDNQKISNDIYKKLRDSSYTTVDKDITANSIMSIIQNLYFPRQFGKFFKVPVRLIRSFFIEVFIYYQNKNSPLMNYIYGDKEKDYSPIPYSYNLNGACIEGRFSYIILSPLKLEPRINKISLSQNNLRECGLYEIGKVILFNKNIKNIDFNTCLLRNNYLEFLNSALGLFDNDSVEVLNISYNYLKDICEENLAKLLTHFKGLKTINITGNEFKRGVSSFLVVLKKLYRTGKTKLENLYLNKCIFDEATYYELGELLKCKYCKLKKLYLNYNPIPSNINFLKKLKKNKSLTEIYLNKKDIGNNDVYDIMKIISNTEINHLYLYNNKISNFQEILKILYRTKLIKDNNNIIIDNDSIILSSIDLSNNNNTLLIKNYSHIKLLKNIFKQTTLDCIDLSHNLYGLVPNNYKENNKNKYTEYVNDLIDNLNQEKNDYIHEIDDFKKNEYDVKKNKKLENEKMLNDINEEIFNIIKDEKSIYTVFLKKEAKKIIFNEKNKEIREKVFKNNTIDKKEYKIMEKKLVDYMVLKRSEIKLAQIEEIRKAKKLIII